MATKIEPKFTTQTVTIANGQPAGIREFRFPFDKDYKTAKSLYMIERSNGGNASNYRVGMRNESGLQVRDLTPNEAYRSATSVPIADRYIPLNIDAQGKNIIVSVETFAQTSADLIFDIVYVLTNQE